MEEESDFKWGLDCGWQPEFRLAATVEERDDWALRMWTESDRGAGAPKKRGRCPGHSPWQGSLPLPH